MKPVNLHAHEDRLLELAYGELSPVEAQAVQAHVASCARCAQELDAIRGVRHAMAPLAATPPPDAGLDSLLAYAEQAARRASAGPTPKPSRWRRWFLPVVGVASLATAAVLVVRVASEPPRAAAVDVSAKQDPVAQLDAELANRREAERQLQAEEAARAEAPPSAFPASPAPPPPPSKALAVKDAEKKAEPGYVPVKLKKGTRSMMGRGEGSGGPGPVAEADVPMGNAEIAYAPPSADDAQEAGAQAGSVSRDLAGAKLDEAPPAVASAPPAPSSAAPAPARTGGTVRKESTAPSTRAAEAAPAAAAPQEPLAQRAEPPASVAGLSAQARTARQQGDRASEVRLLREALAAGPLTTEQLGLLDRLCDAELALGRAAGAREACGALVQLAPDSSQARSAQKRLAGAGLSLPAN